MIAPPVLTFLVSLALRAWSALARPTAASCPEGWWLATGVQRDGSFACYYDRETEQWPPIDAPHGAVITGRIVCSGDMYPVQVGDGRRVRCKGGPRS